MSNTSKTVIAVIGLVIQCTLIVLGALKEADNRQMAQKREEHLEQRQADPDIVQRKLRAFSGLKNKGDMEKLFQNGASEDDSDGYIYSHNVFSTPKYDHLTIDLCADTCDQNGYYGNNRIVTSGLVTYCSYDLEKQEAVSFRVKEPFLLRAEDYNNDGHPDFVLRVKEPVNNVSCYALAMTDPFSDKVTTNRSFNEHIQNSIYDCAFAVWGRDGYSITFDRLDGKRFFFLTPDADGEPSLAVFEELSPADPSVYTEKDYLFSAVYSDDVISMKATSTHVNKDKSGEDRYYQLEGEYPVKIKKLDGQVFRDLSPAGFSGKAVFEKQDSMTSLARFDQFLSWGTYILEIEVNGEKQSAWLEIY